MSHEDDNEKSCVGRETSVRCAFSFSLNHNKQEKAFGNRSRIAIWKEKEIGYTSLDSVRQHTPSDTQEG